MADVTPKPALRIAITQRHLPASDTTFARDALDTAWSSWFVTHWPAADFLAIPNFLRPADALEYLETWGVTALLLSGGEDIGTSPVRDALEATLLDYASAVRMPVLGVCRGMQMLHVHAGGTLVEQAGHVGLAHPVRCGDTIVTVNSWHRFAVGTPSPDWEVLGAAKGGSIEAMRHTRLPWLAVMWHPERPDGNPALMWQWINATMLAR